jgi:hypothetical protein
MKTFFFRTILIFLLFFSFIFSSFAGDNTGIDPVLNLAGIEKPEKWSFWKEYQKHNWLKSKGIFPKNGRKYKGEFDIEKYFQFLETEIPKNWENKSFIERKFFVKNIKNKTSIINTESSLENNISEKKPNNENFGIMFIFGSIIGSLVISSIYFYKKY